MVQDTAPPGRPTFATLAQYADINIDLNARLETQFDRLRNLNCTAADVSNPASGCQGGFPTPVLDQQFALRAGGVLGDRLNVNVDFDSQREFNANNTITMWYQGLEDDILRRVEVGNLDFRLPASRFIATSIPAKSFGVQAEAQLGPLEFRAILAQQKGSSVRARVFTVGEQATQLLTRESRDVEFEDGRFFFVVNPTLLPTFPNVDVLNIVQQALPAELQVAQVRAYRLRTQSGQAGINPSLRGIEAVAVRDDSPQFVGPFFWDLLIEGQDYYLDPSGLWFGLRNRVGLNEFLAVSYVTLAGDTVGTFPAVGGPRDTLLLIHEPRRGPEVPTFLHEMRNFYRIGGAISRNSIDLALLVNDSERPLDGVGTYIARLGLATATDPSLIDEFNRVFPRERDPNGGLPLRDLFVVFPHLQPFADSLRLQEGERNDSLYRTPTYLRNTQGPAPRFRFAWEYQTTGAGDRSQLHLGALQLRSGSERIRIGNRDLVRGRDYEMSYDLGIVTFLNPDSLFPGPTEVQVQFEQNQLFDVAPSTVFGFQSTYSLGSIGRIDGVTLVQRERTVFTRPELGFEPQTMFLGGLSTELRFQTDFVTRALDALPLLKTNVPSTLAINGEIAMSRPNPNQTGQAYLEEFEGVSTRFIRLGEQAFQLGSRPTSGRGIPPTHLSPFGEFATEDATAFVWQNVLDLDGEPFEIGPAEIDSSIVLTGASVPKETLLWFSLKPDTIGGAPHPVTGAPRWIRPHVPGPRWRSITTPLDQSGLGVDLSRVEFLEFWALEDLRAVIERQEAILVFDFGTVMEDAVAFGPDSFRVTGTDTVFSGFQQLGAGELDSERDPFTAVFNAEVNDVGIHGDLLPSIVNITTGGELTDFPTCERVFTGVSIPAFPLGDLGARCTRRNGFVDSEDLNGDNRLDLQVGVTQEDVIRYVVPLGDPRFVVRIGKSVPRAGQSVPRIGGVARTWRLYRIPFRQDTVQFGTPNIRRVRSLRITMLTPDQPLGETEISLALARLSFVGAPWLKRAETPIAGIGGLQGEPHGEVLASTISTADKDLGYTSPPGVIDEASRQGAAFEFTSQEINERSLRLIARDLRLGERAEAFRRFSNEADKNFLQYRALRAWARGRGPGWESGDLEFFLKVGSDEDNFYMYSVPARTVDWEPEVVVEIDRWLRLRTDAERDWLSGAPPSGSELCGGDSTAFVRCDGPYLVQIKDPAVRPPNLARVSEIAVGMLRVGQAVAIPEAELWVDDIRLTDVVGDAGVAGYVEVRLTAADFADVEFSYSSTDDRFRQIDEAPDYLSDTQTRIGSTVRLDKLLPESWGMSVPFSVQHQRVSTDPFFVRGTDVLAEALDGLRKPSSSATSYQVALRRSRRGDSFAERLLLDPLALSASRLDAESVSELSSAKTSNRSARAVYDNRPAPQTIRGAPAFFVKFVDGLPGWISNSEFGRALRSSRLRWNPYQIRLSSELVDNLTDRLTFRVPVALPQDSVLAPLRSVVHSWRNTVGADVRPFSSLGLRVDYMSTRDLQDYGDSTLVGRLTGEERVTFFGKDIGFEREQTLSTRFTASPAINSWLRPRFSTSSSFVFHRDPNGRVAVQVDIDSLTIFRIPEAVSNFRQRLLGSTLDLRRLAEVIGGPTSTVARMFRGLFPADVSFLRERRSTFDRITFVPDMRYRLAFGNTDEFREQDGDLALSAVERGVWTVAGGTRLPLGFGLRFDYRRTESTTWARRGESQSEITQRFEQWPSGSVSWVYTPPPFLRGALSSVSAQARYRRTVGSSFQPAALQAPGPDSQGGANGTTGIFAENRATNVTPTITLTWLAGVVTTARFSRIRSEVLTSGNSTLNDERSWGGSVNFSFRAPTTIFRLPSDVRTSLTVNATDATLCQKRAESPECAIVSDSRRRQVNIRMDTGFPPSMRGGASFSYVLTEERHTASKVSQMVFTIFLDINFLASQVRR
ncbi:MAG: cell surface protein SprA [Gemmatimonadetes bacterium]|nr:cell surface protein SprA [Gemmatimonadota bacterium]